MLTEVIPDSLSQQVAQSKTLSELTKLPKLPAVESKVSQELANLPVL